jgi:1-phosphofructokinase/tagatose 6-phosphate kinase
MVEQGAREAIMTLRTGCIALLGDEHERVLIRAELEPEEPVSKVGSGDAFLAGYLASRYTGNPPEECARFAVACGAESTKHFGAGVLDPREVERLMGEVRVDRLEAGLETARK